MENSQKLLNICAIKKNCVCVRVCVYVCVCACVWLYNNESKSAKKHTKNVILKLLTQEENTFG